MVRDNDFENTISHNPCSNVDRSATWRKLDGIFEQVCDHSLHAVTIHLGWWQALRHVQTYETIAQDQMHAV
jgi:hypothetical protein